MTKIINLFAGPGAGKSTTAAGVFYELKSRGQNVELVTEVAKDFTWAQRWGCLRCQPFVFGKQLSRIERLIDKVDIVVTDSPILLSAVYDEKYTFSFKSSVLDIFNMFDNINYYVERAKPYLQIGRDQNEARAHEIDRKTREFLLDNLIPFSIIKGNATGVELIVDDNRIKEKQNGKQDIIQVNTKV